MKIVIAGDFPEETREEIRGCFPEDWTLRILPPEEVARALADADVLIPEHMRLDEALLARAERLRLVQTGAGFDNVDLAACQARGVRVCSAPGVNAGAVAEHVLACILCWYRNLLLLDRELKAGKEVRDLRYAGGELAGKTVGILGLGHVGRRVAALCGAFGMRVLGWSRSAEPVPGLELRDLDSLLRESEILSVHLALNESTRHFLGAEELGKMRADALLVNTARGAVIDEAALLRALERREIAGACLDVFEEEPLPVDSPFRRLDNVILTPHSAGLPDGVKFHRRRYLFFAENIRRICEGR